MEVEVREKMCLKYLRRGVERVLRLVRLQVSCWPRRRSSSPRSLSAHGSPVGMEGTSGRVMEFAWMRVAPMSNPLPGEAALMPASWFSQASAWPFRLWATVALVAPSKDDELMTMGEDQ